MKCPICKKGTLALCQDAIVPWSIKKTKDGYETGPAVKNATNYLDNTWLECSGETCNASNSSDTGEWYQELEDIYEALL